METETRVESVSFEVDDVRHVVAERDFRDYTRPYESTVFGRLCLFVDGTEVTHRNRLPAAVDLVDTARAQRELVDRLDATGEYRDVPFCGQCSDRGCVYVEFAITDTGDGTLSLRVRDLLDRPVGKTPYRVRRDALYRGFHEFWRTVEEFCATERIETFPWADWKTPPVAGRDHYATLTELRDWCAFLEERLDPQ